MKALKFIGNFFGVILSIVLSLILVVLLIAMPILSAASSLVQPETITDLVLDYVEVIKSNPDIQAGLAETGITAEQVGKVLESDFVEDLIEVYVEDVFSVIDGNSPKLNVETLREIANDNMDELVELFKDIAPNLDMEEIPVTDEDIQAAIHQIVDELGAEIIASLPTPEDLGIIPSGKAAAGSSSAATSLEATEPTTESLPELIGDGPVEEPVDDTATLLQVVRKLHDGTIMMTLIAVVAVISLLIALFRWPRFKGFMWLGVDYAIAAGVSFLLAPAVETLLVLFEIDEEYQSMLAPITNNIASNVTKVAVIEAVLAVLFIAIFVAGRILLKKFKAKKLAAQ